MIFRAGLSRGLGLSPLLLSSGETNSRELETIGLERLPQKGRCLQTGEKRRQDVVAELWLIHGDQLSNVPIVKHNRGHLNISWAFKYGMPKNIVDWDLSLIFFWQFFLFHKNSLFLVPVYFSLYQSIRTYFSCVLQEPFVSVLTCVHIALTLICILFLHFQHTTH